MQDVHLNIENCNRDIQIGIFGSSMMRKDTELLCVELGVYLKALRNVTLITDGRKGCGEVVASVFGRAGAAENNKKNIIHFYPFVDWSRGADKTSAPGSFVRVGSEVVDTRKCLAQSCDIAFFIEGGGEGLECAKIAKWDNKLVIPFPSTSAHNEFFYAKFADDEVKVMWEKTFPEHDKNQTGAKDMVKKCIKYVDAVLKQSQYWKYIAPANE